MGYVVHRHHRWYAVGYEGVDPLTGKDRRRWHRATDETDARRLAGTLPPAAPAAGAHGMTVARFLRTRWLPARAGLLRPTTLYRYAQMTEHYVVPHIGPRQTRPLGPPTPAHYFGPSRTLRLRVRWSPKRAFRRCCDLRAARQRGGARRPRAR